MKNWLYGAEGMYNLLTKLGVKSSPNKSNINNYSPIGLISHKRK